MAKGALQLYWVGLAGWALSATACLARFDEDYPVRDPATGGEPGVAGGANAGAAITAGGAGADGAAGAAGNTEQGAAGVAGYTEQGVAGGAGYTEAGVAGGAGDAGSVGGGAGGATMGSGGETPSGGTGGSSGGSAGTGGGGTGGDTGTAGAGCAGESCGAELPSFPVGTLLFWMKNLGTSTSVLPSGWAECDGRAIGDPASPLNGVVLPDLSRSSRFLRGSSVSGATGGRATHAHTFNTGRNPSGGSYLALSSDATDPTNNEPPYYDAVPIINTLAAASVQTPLGSIVGRDDSLSGVPSPSAGWLPLDGQTVSDPESPYNGLALPNLNGSGAGVKRFLRSASSNGGTGGAETHRHALSLTASASSSTGLFYITESTNTSTSSHLPPYYEVRWVGYVRAPDVFAPGVGTIVPWLKSLPGVPALPSSGEYAECNGQVIDDPMSPLDGQSLPDLNGEHRYLRGATASGARGGAATHNHDLLAATDVLGVSASSSAVQAFQNPSSTQDHEPPYYEVVYVIRVK